MKTKNLYWKIIIFSFLICQCLPQAAYSQGDKVRQEAGLFIYNCGFGAVTAGVGAVINKRKQERVMPTFWKGFKYGALGGLINYGSKRIDFLITKYNDYPYICPNTNTHNDAALLWAWPTKMVHAVGSSIIENAAANKPNVFKDYNMPIGFINLSVSIKDKIVVRPQLMPYSFYCFMSVLTNNITLNNTPCLNEKNTFKLKESLLLGSPYFVVDSKTINSKVDYAKYYKYSGVNAYRTILVDSKYDNSTYSGHIKAHELIHSLQDDEYLVFNQYFSKIYNKTINRNSKAIKIMEKYIRSDVPFFGGFYALMYNKVDYYKNYYEMEAEHFASNRFIKP